MFWAFVAIGVFFAFMACIAFAPWIGIQYVPNDRVGIKESLWGRHIEQGRIIALKGETGFQPDVLRGGFYFGLYRWKYRIHKVPFVAIPQGKIGYVYARDGEALSASQTLGRIVGCNNFQDAKAFLGGDHSSKPQFGQRGRQRAVLREGVYAINLSLFTIIAEDQFYSLGTTRAEAAMLRSWQEQLESVDGFNPIVIGAKDDIGIVTVQDGPVLPSGEIIAPAASDDHDSFQSPEQFLAGGGMRGRQYQALTDGTYFINRWFATVESKPKTLVPIGYVGVVISYFGLQGKDISGDNFRHGERVATGQKGVWDKPLPPGKYAFNEYAGQVVLVPTTNFVLHWITGKTEQSHKYDENLRSIDLVTLDAYEPVLPLSLVVHIDYQKAPGVVQRFGDVKKLINQSIDPMLSAYFRDICHKRSMLELLRERDQIQAEARKELRERFQQFDLECIDVLIGKPEPGASDGGKIEALLEQLRQRQLSREQIETFEQQKSAAEKRRTLEEATATADRQKDLTYSQVQIRIVENEANAQLAKAQMQKQQTIVEAEGQLEKSRRSAEQQIVLAKAASEQTVIEANAKSQQEILLGKGEGQRRLQIGLSEAISLQQKVNAYGDPRLYAVVLAAERIAKSRQPLVPERVFAQGGHSENGKDNGGAGNNPLNTLLSIVLADATVFQQRGETNPVIKDMTEKLLATAMGTLSASSQPTAALPEPNGSPKK
jgi:uncharacterized membrane protein YqiK